ncbi:rCG55353 [Rattus norvegicus]|uniref:RCG55353 n=1 Tax=Rattus norvegicus TaxID=10116 RepID=A6JR45_RAT|nr:rCG55353 [Rattus norvegicus]
MKIKGKLQVFCKAYLFIHKIGHVHWLFIVTFFFIFFTLSLTVI